MYPIPANATRIRYLESTGTQYVDTGVIITPQSSVSLDVAFTSISTGAADAQHNGFVKGSDSGNYRTIIGVDNGLKKVYSIGNTLQLSADLDRHVFLADYKNLVVSIGSATQSISGTFTGSFTRSFYIFARNESGTPALFCHEKLYGAQFWQNGVLVRSFVPVRVGTVGYLFDRVSGQLFGNAGTGDFVLGPDTFAQGVLPTRMMAMGVRKRPYDAEVEYIRSTGRQYIQLPSIKITQTTTIRFGVSVSSAANSNFLGQYGKAISGVFNGLWRFQAAYTWVQTNASVSTYPTVEWECGFANGSRILRNGSVLWSNSSRTPGTGSSSMALFAIRNAQGGIEMGTCSCRYLLILDGDTELHSFQPVRVGTVGALYDRVSGALYYSATSTALIPGPDLP